jgi:hypothetical protein
MAVAVRCIQARSSAELLDNDHGKITSSYPYNEYSFAKFSPFVLPYAQPFAW